jgi:hypothetical protein
VCVLYKDIFSVKTEWVNDLKFWQKFFTQCYIKKYIIIISCNNISSSVISKNLSW